MFHVHDLKQVNLDQLLGFYETSEASGLSS